MPVLALLNVPPALVARHRLKLVQAISRSQLSNLVADRAQLKIWNARSKAFADEQDGVVLDPLAQSISIADSYVAGRTPFLPP
jgi:hypothetical protein